MKTILLPTDYSKASVNAVHYALMLARQTKSRLLLFHAFQVPVVTSEAAVVVVPFDDLEKINNTRIKKMADNLRKKYKTSVEIDHLAQAGFAVDMIKELTQSKKIDLVVMGIKGAGKISEIVVGSTSSSIAGNVRCPVLIVPEKAVFEKPKKIIFASDNEKPGNISNLKIVNELAKVFKSKLLLLTVIDASQSEEADMKKALKIEKYFKDFNHSVHFSKNTYNDVVAVINQFVKESKAGMVVMIARKHSFLSRVFNERKTKKMAFHTRIPLLVLSDVSKV